MAEYSYNGWLASKNPAAFGGLQKLIVSGESFAPGVRAGDVRTVLEYVARQLHERVEPVVRPDWHQADDWGYSYRKNMNDKNLSCHASGTAFDYNATRHPNGKRGTFSPTQVREIRKILAEVDNVVRWGGDFSKADEMHFEVFGPESAVRNVARRLRAAPESHGGRLLRLTQPFTRGDDVRALQERLNRDYPRYSNLVVDGVFGPATDLVVREFQYRAGLTVDGIVGPATRRALRL